MTVRRRGSGTPEGGILKAGMGLFRLRGFPCWRINGGAMRYGDNRRVFFVLGPDGKPFHGFSDTLFVVPPVGRIGACEFKAPGGKPTPHQLAFLETVRGRGGVALVVRDLDTLIRVLDALDADPWARFTLDGVPASCP